MSRKDKTETVDFPQYPMTEPEPPRISVIDRRLKHPFGTPSREIPLKGERRNWVVRTFSADPEHPNRHFDAVYRLGWIPLTADDIAVSVESLGFVKAVDGRIVRGAGGHEVLMGMPAKDFAAVQKAKSDANLRGLRSSAIKEEVAQATAVRHGDQGGEFVQKHFEQKEITEPI